MAHKFEIIGNFLVVSENGNERLECPAQDVVGKVEDDKFVVFERNADKGNTQDLIRLPIADCVGPDDTPFTEATIKDWSRTNLAFSAAGSSASPTMPTGGVSVQEVDADGVDLTTLGTIRIVRGAAGSSLEIIDSNGEQVI